MATFKDKFGTEWNVFEPAKSGGNLSGSLVQPAYATDAGTVVIVAPTLARLIEEANAYADDFIKSGGKPPARGSLDVTATKSDGGALLLLALLALALLGGKRR